MMGMMCRDDGGTGIGFNETRSGDGVKKLWNAFPRGV